MKKNKKNRKYHTVRTVPKSTRKIVERGKIDTTNTQIHDHSPSWPSIEIAIKSGGTKPGLWTQMKKKLIHKPNFNGKRFDVRMWLFNQSAPNITSIYYRYFFL